MTIVYNDLTLQNQNDIVEKAKTKPDGVYTLRGIFYRVRNGRVTHFASKGEVVQACGHFNIVLGTYGTKDEGRKLLQGIA